MQTQIWFISFKFSSSISLPSSLQFSDFPYCDSPLLLFLYKERLQSKLGREFIALDLMSKVWWNKSAGGKEKHWFSTWGSKEQSIHSLSDYSSPLSGSWKTGSSSLPSSLGTSSPEMFLLGSFLTGKDSFGPFFG